MFKVHACSDRAWDETAHQDSSCTFFQTRPWYSLVAPYISGEPFPVLFDFGNAQAVLPLIRRSKLIWEFYQSPFGTYSAVLCAQKLSAENLRDIAAWLENKNASLFSSPLTNNPTPMGRRSSNATYMVELKNLDRMDVATVWAKNQRRHLRKGRAAGIAVRRAASPEDIGAYLGIYAKSHARWDRLARGRYPDALFHALWNGLKETDSLRFWIAEHEGRIVGGDICFYHNEHAVQWHGVVDADFFSAGANQVLLGHIIQDAADRGFANYDMNPSGGLENVENFKKDFGSRRVEFENYASLSPSYFLAHKLGKLLRFR